MTNEIKNLTAELEAFNATRNAHKTTVEAKNDFPTINRSYTYRKSTAL